MQSGRQPRVIAGLGLAISDSPPGCPDPARTWRGEGPQGRYYGLRPRPAIPRDCPGIDHAAPQ